MFFFIDYSIHNYLDYSDFVQHVEKMVRDEVLQTFDVVVHDFNDVHSDSHFIKINFLIVVYLVVDVEVAVDD